MGGTQRSSPACRRCLRGVGEDERRRTCTAQAPSGPNANPSRDRLISTGVISPVAGSHHSARVCAVPNVGATVCVDVRRVGHEEQIGGLEPAVHDANGRRRRLERDICAFIAFCNASPSCAGSATKSAGARAVEQPARDGSKSPAIGCALSQSPARSDGLVPTAITVPPARAKASRSRSVSGVVSFDVRKDNGASNGERRREAGVRRSAVSRASVIGSTKSRLKPASRMAGITSGPTRVFSTLDQVDVAGANAAHASCTGSSSATSTTGVP